MRLITLKAEQIKEKISDELLEVMADKNFIYKKTSNSFIQKNDLFTNTFFIEQLSWSTSVSLNIRLDISVKAVEDILHKILGKQRHTITIGQELGRIYESPDGREVINGNLSIWMYYDQDINAAIETIKVYFIEIAEPYFQKYKTLAAIDDIINNPPFEHCPAHVGGMFYERCMKGLIVARLVSNPNYEKLVTIYDEEIKETMNAEFIESYYKVKEYLMYNRITN